MKVVRSSAKRFWYGSALLTLIGGCGGGAAGTGGASGGSADDASPPTPVVTSVMVIGTSSESCTVTATAAVPGQATVAIVDGDPRPTAWSLRGTQVDGEVELTITTTDAAGNGRVYSAGVSTP